MVKKCRERTDILLNDEMKKAKQVMKETLESLKEEVEKYKKKPVSDPILIKTKQ